MGRCGVADIDELIKSEKNADQLLTLASEFSSKKGRLMLLLVSLFFRHLFFIYKVRKKILKLAYIDVICVINNARRRTNPLISGK